MPHHIHLPRPMIKQGPISHQHSRWPLILIGITKLFKAVVLVGVSFLAAYLLKPDQHQHLESILDEWRLDPHSHNLSWGLSWVLEKVLSVDKQHLQAARWGTLLYSVLFFAEGIGLLLDKAWAEWLLVVTTGLLLPVEVYEVIHSYMRGHAWWRPLIVLGVNSAMMVYVIYRLKWRFLDKRTAGGGHKAKGKSAKH